MNLTKIEKTEFLKNGGTLLRAGFNTQKEFVIKKKTYSKDWYIHLTCTSQAIAFGIIDKLCELHPDKFKKSI